ncbi:substrate-binding domain-containing protein [Pseudarthrobacter sp. N5]|uniref:substrate-binding domain-containing protein n=1 Tax=Pseudarthrobacter sp. N5 TaxID=3418416 RepID=UPI003CEF5169
MASASASGLAAGRARIIGVVAQDLASLLFAESIEAVGRVLHRRNYSLSFCVPGGSAGAGLEIHLAAPAVDGGRIAFRRLWRQSGPRPTAICCTSEEMAVGLMLEACRRGVSIPDELSLIGIGGHPVFAGLGLTTVDYRPGEQAEVAVNRLLDAIEGMPGRAAPSHRTTRTDREDQYGTAACPILPPLTARRSPAAAGQRYRREALSASR